MTTTARSHSPLFSSLILFFPLPSSNIPQSQLHTLVSVLYPRLGAAPHMRGVHVCERRERHNCAVIMWAWWCWTRRCSLLLFEAFHSIGPLLPNNRRVGLPVIAFQMNLAPWKAARCTGCHTTNITPLLASFTGQDDAQQEPVGKLQSSLRIPELRHYECTTIWHQGLAGDDTRRVGKVCQPTLRRPGGRLPDWSVEGAGEEWKKTKQNKKNTQRGNRGGRRCILHWIKLQTFLEALAYISGEYERGRDITVCANMI